MMVNIFFFISQVHFGVAISTCFAGISWVITAESSPLRVAGSRTRTGKSVFPLGVAVRVMLKTWVKLGNISLLSINLIKRLIFVMFKHSFPSQRFHTVSIHIFSLVHQLWLFLALTFVPLPYLLG